MADPARLREALRRFAEAAHGLADALADPVQPVERPKRRRKIVPPMPEGVTDTEIALARRLLRREGK